MSFKVFQVNYSWLNCVLMAAVKNITVKCGLFNNFSAKKSLQVPLSARYWTLPLVFQYLLS